MKRQWFAAASCCFLFCSGVAAEENLRLGRPAHPQQNVSDQPAATGEPQISSMSAPAIAPPRAQVRPGTQQAETQASLSGGDGTDAQASQPAVNPLKANASFDQQNQAASQPFETTVYDWQSRNQLGLQSATTDSAHKGLKSHLGGMASKAGTVVGVVARAYIPTVNVALKNSPPKISVDAGHCPASNDPAFQVPIRWWDNLSEEQSRAVIGEKWKLWLTAVQAVFQSHAHELRETPGVASLHVMVNPDGSIYNMTPYLGAERANAGHPVNERALQHLRQIVQSVGRFPPFPQGTRVRCYHLIFDGSAGI